MGEHVNIAIAGLSLRGRRWLARRASRVKYGPAAPASFLPPLRAAIAVTAALLAACGCSAAPAFCAATTTSPLINGGDVPGLPLSSGAQAAIGALRTSAGELVCTGTYLGDRWVVTARHCVDAATFEALVFQTSRDLTELSVTAAEYYPHPELDVLLLRVPPSAALAAVGMEPIALWPASEPRDWTGATVTLAGLGDTADGSDGRRQFLDEPVVASDANTIVVDGGAEHGACTGDSGGPLLVASPPPLAPRLIGILSGGSATCRGRDRYVASTAFDAWVADVRGTASQDPCAGLTSEGTCQDGLARWCAGQWVEAERCTGDRLCGWSAAANGYRCVASEQDPCRGAGPGGDCDGTTLRVCQRGTLVEADCGACGLICDRGVDGHAGCV
jgi:hypothetical protein